MTGSPKLSKRVPALLLAAIILIIACACGDSAGAGTQSTNTTAQGSKIYSLATASLGGTYYIVGTGVAEAVTNSVPNLTVNSIIAQGSTGNVLLLESGEVDLAMTNYYSGYNALNAQSPYDHKIELAGICPLQYSILQFCTFANRDDINTLSDLSGKKVSIGPAGGGGALMYKELLPFWGITQEDTNVSNLSYSEGTDALNDKKIDVNVPHGAPPLEAISSLAAFSDIKILNLETDKMNQVVAEYPYYDIAVIPGGTYKGIDEDVQSAGIQDILTISLDADEEEVYQITKAIYEALDTLHKVHPSLEEMTFDGYKDSLVPLHPGARRFYEENNIPLS